MGWNRWTWCFTTELKASNIKSVSSIEYPEIKNNIFNNCILFNNKFYIATHKGIVILDKSFQFNKTVINEYSINTLKAINNKIWLATNAGLIVIDTTGKIIKQFNTTNSILKSNNIFCLFEYDNSTVWIGTDNGLYSIDKNSYSIKSLIPEFFKNITSTNYILNLVNDDKNNIWICHTYGTTKYNRVTKTSENFHYSSLNKCSISHRITTSATSYNNIMYIGTLGGGLSLHNNQTNCFEKFTTNNGLSSDMVSSITSNNTNKLWIGTYNGLNEFDVKTQKCKIYNINNGLLSNEINFNGISIIENNIFVCSTSGLNIISNIKKNSIEKIKPPIIKHLYLSGEQLSDTIKEINAKSENTKITLQMCYPHLNNQNLVYQFKFKGKDSVYTTLQKGNNQIIFENMKYGNYELQIRMFDLNNENSSEPINFNINILQPFYKNIYFIILSSILFCCIIFYWIYNQQKTKNKIELQKLEIEQKILTERERISKDLHDNIGSQLTYIISNLDYIKHNNNIENIDDVRNYARDTVQQLRNTIWALSYDKVSLGEFSHRVKSYLLDYLSIQKNIKFNSEFNGNEELEVSPTILLNLFRVIQEVAQNIVKHAMASSVNINYEINNNVLKITITDNGKGFDATTNNENYGLKNIKYRIEEIGGNIKIESEHNKGTTIQITCSIKNERN
ncbi:MAG: histidine kinase [Bacteroidetes bacterium]|nr:histidine kinase [Bacteroidota bacterium]